MGGGGKGGSNSTNQMAIQRYEPDPLVAQAGHQAIQMAEGASQAPFQQPVAPVAGFTPQQTLGFQETQQAQGMAQPYLHQAAQLATQSAQPVSASQVQNYYNPFAQNVMANLGETFAQQQRDTTGQLTQAAGGVGADRIAVGQSELARQQGLAAGQTAANIYQPALYAALTDPQREAQASFALGSIGPAAQTAQLQGIGALLGTGGQQQNLEQAQQTAGYQQELARLGYPFQTAQYLAGIAGGLGPALGGTTTMMGSAQGPTPSGFQQAAGLGLGAAGLGGSLFGGNLGVTSATPFSGYPGGFERGGGIPHRQLGGEIPMGGVPGAGGMGPSPFGGALGVNAATPMSGAHPGGGNALENALPLMGMAQLGHNQQQHHMAEGGSADDEQQPQTPHGSGMPPSAHPTSVVPGAGRSVVPGGAVRGGSGERPMLTPPSPMPPNNTNLQLAQGLGQLGGNAIRNFTGGEGEPEQQGGAVDAGIGDDPFKNMGNSPVVPDEPMRPGSGERPMLKPPSPPQQQGGSGGKGAMGQVAGMLPMMMMKGSGGRIPELASGGGLHEPQHFQLGGAEAMGPKGGGDMGGASGKGSGGDFAGNAMGSEGQFDEMGGGMGGFDAMMPSSGWGISEGSGGPDMGGGMEGTAGGDAPNEQNIETQQPTGTPQSQKQSMEKAQTPFAGGSKKITEELGKMAKQAGQQDQKQGPQGIQAQPSESLASSAQSPDKSSLGASVLQGLGSNTLGNAQGLQGGEGLGSLAGTSPTNLAMAAMNPAYAAGSPVAAAAPYVAGQKQGLLDSPGGMGGQQGLGPGMAQSSGGLRNVTTSEPPQNPVKQEAPGVAAQQQSPFQKILSDETPQPVKAGQQYASNETQNPKPNAAPNELNEINRLLNDYHRSSGPNPNPIGPVGQRLNQDLQDIQGASRTPFGPPLGRDAPGGWAGDPVKLGQPSPFPSQGMPQEMPQGVTRGVTRGLSSQAPPAPTAVQPQQTSSSPFTQTVGQQEPTIPQKNPMMTQPIPHQPQPQPAAPPAQQNAALKGYNDPAFRQPPRVSKELSDWVAKKENFSPKPFNDYGQTNIGYGTAANGRSSISEPDARAEMNRELQKYSDQIYKLNPNLPQGAHDALTSLSYNTGGTWMHNSGLADAVRRGDIPEMQRIFTQYNKAGGQELAGLTNRRNQEASMFTNANYIGSGQGTTAAQDWGGTQAPNAGGAPQVAQQPQAPQPMNSDRLSQVTGIPKEDVDRTIAGIAAFKKTTPDALIKELQTPQGMADLEKAWPTIQRAGFTKAPLPDWKPEWTQAAAQTAAPQPGGATRSITPQEQASPTPQPVSDQAQANRPQFYRGNFKVEGSNNTYTFGSGGRGPSMPYGHHIIDGMAEGQFGRSVGAFHVADMWDAKEGRMRTAMEIHPETTPGGQSAGCLTIPNDQYAQFTADVNRIRAANGGKAALDINEDGSASIHAPGKEGEFGAPGKTTSGPPNVRPWGSEDKQPAYSGPKVDDRGKPIANQRDSSTGAPYGRRYQPALRNPDGSINWNVMGPMLMKMGQGFAGTSPAFGAAGLLGGMASGMQQGIASGQAEQSIAQRGEALHAQALHAAASTAKLGTETEAAQREMTRGKDADARIQELMAGQPGAGLGPQGLMAAKAATGESQQNNPFMLTGLNTPAGAKPGETTGPGQPQPQPEGGEGQQRATTVGHQAQQQPTQGGDNTVAGGIQRKQQEEHNQEQEEKTKEWQSSMQRAQMLEQQANIYRQYGNKEQRNEAAQLQSEANNLRNQVRQEQQFYSTPHLYSEDFMGNKTRGLPIPGDQEHFRTPQPLGGQPGGQAPGNPAMTQQDMAAISKTIAEDKTGPEMLQSLPPHIARRVQGIVEGSQELPPASTMGGRTNMRELYAQLAAQYDPGWNQDAAKQKSKTWAEYNNPSGNHPGRWMIALRTLMGGEGHVREMAAASEEINNAKLRGANFFKNWITSELGEAQKKRFETNRDALASEISYLFKGGVPAVEDTKRDLEHLGTNDSQIQQYGVLEKLSKLFNGRAKGFGDQYEATMAATAPGPHRKLEAVTKEMQETASLVHDKYIKLGGKEVKLLGAERLPMNETPESASPQGGGASAGPMEGQTATNPRTGEKVIRRNGKWVPQ